MQTMKGIFFQIFTRMDIAYNDGQKGIFSFLRGRVCKQEEGTTLITFINSFAHNILVFRAFIAATCCLYDRHAIQH